MRARSITTNCADLFINFTKFYSNLYYKTLSVYLKTKIIIKVSRIKHVSGEWYFYLTLYLSLRRQFLITVEFSEETATLIRSARHSSLFNLISQR